MLCSGKHSIHSSQRLQEQPSQVPICTRVIMRTSTQAACCCSEVASCFSPSALGLEVRCQHHNYVTQERPAAKVQRVLWMEQSRIRATNAATMEGTIWMCISCPQAESLYCVRPSGCSSRN